MSTIKEKVAQIIGKEALAQLTALLPKEIKLSTGEKLEYKGELKAGAEVKLFAADGKEIANSVEKVYSSDKNKFTVKEGKLVKFEDIVQEAPEAPIEEEKPATEQAEGDPASLEMRIAKLEEMVASIMESTQATMAGVEQSLKAVRLMADAMDEDYVPESKGGEMDIKELKAIRRDRLIAGAKTY